MANRLSIEYCVPCGYHPRAVELATEIEKRFGQKPDLVKGTAGVFEVTLGDELVFSKRKLGRFPLPGEVEQELARRLSA